MRMEEKTYYSVVMGKTFRDVEVLETYTNRGRAVLMADELRRMEPATCKHRYLVAAVLHDYRPGHILDSFALDAAGAYLEAQK